MRYYYLYIPNEMNPQLVMDALMSLAKKLPEGSLSFEYDSQLDNTRRPYHGFSVGASLDIFKNQHKYEVVFEGKSIALAMVKGKFIVFWSHEQCKQ